MSIADLRACPVINYVRMAYGVVVLIKLSLLASAAFSAVGHIVDPETVEILPLLERLIPRLAEAAKGGMCRIAGKFGMVLVMLGGWYRKKKFEELRGQREVGAGAAGDDELIEPLRHLDLVVEEGYRGRPERPSCFAEISERDVRDAQQHPQQTHQQQQRTEQRSENLLPLRATAQPPQFRKSFDFDPFDLFAEPLPPTPPTSQPAPMPPSTVPQQPTTASTQRSQYASNPQTETGLASDPSAMDPSPFSNATFQDVNFDELGMHLDIGDLDPRSDMSADVEVDVDDWTRRYFDTTGSEIAFGSEYQLGRY
jgi:hypothetical protein